jgi:uncharacterized RDD family membrane protein YckC
MGTVLYAHLLPRIQALVTDMLLLVGLFLMVVFVPSLVDLAPEPTRFLVLAFIIGAILYEPVLVSLRGGTVGHYRYGIRVTDLQGRKLSIVQAFVRTLVKGILGGLSFVSMIATQRKQSVHDLASRSVVVVADSATAPYEIGSPMEAISRGEKPGAGRRIAFILLYSFALFMVTMAVTLLVLTPQCLDKDICSNQETLLTDVIGVAWLIGTVTIAIQGWRARLWGCRAAKTAA